MPSLADEVDGLLADLRTARHPFYKWRSRQAHASKVWLLSFAVSLLRQGHPQGQIACELAMWSGVEETSRPEIAAILARAASALLPAYGP